MSRLRTIFVVIMVGSLLGLGGCGFTSYPVNALPPQLHKMHYMAGQCSSFNATVWQWLKVCHVELLAKPEKGYPTLRLDYEFHYNRLGTDSSVQARIYNLEAEVTLVVSDSQGHTILGPETVKLSRNVVLQPNELFQATAKVPQAEGELQRELLVGKITNLLNSAQVLYEGQS